MRIALVSDSHIRDGRPALPDCLLGQLRLANLILHAGDLADETGLRLFRAIGPEVIAVAGNMDSAALRSTLPHQTRVETPAGTILLLHILPRVRGGTLATIQQLLPGAPRPLAIVHGHTHYPEIEETKMADGRPAYLINPGSVTRSRGWGHSLAFIEISDAGPRAWIERLD